MKKILATILSFTLLSSFSFAFADSTSDYIVIDVPYVSQLYPTRAVVGCEPTALLMALKSKGLTNDVTLKDFLDAMPKTATDPAKGFAGSPYSPSEKIRTTIYPKPLSEYANTYMPSITRDISGSELEDIKKELLSGNPVVIYATMGWVKPFYKQFYIEGEKQWLLRNNHAVLLTGYDAQNQKFYVADPYNKKSPTKPYFYWISESKLKPIYDERKWAIAIGEAPKPQYPESLEDISPDDYKAVLINETSYQGIMFDEDVYLDLALIVQSELDVSYSYDSSLRSALISSGNENYTINFINGSVYKNNSNIGKLSEKKLKLDEKLYLTTQDIELLLELLNLVTQK